MTDVERFTISDKHVVMEGPRVPSGTPHTDEMRSMVSDLRARGEAFPATAAQFRRVARDIQRQIEANFFLSVRGDYHAGSSVDQRR